MVELKPELTKEDLLQYIEDWDLVTLAEITLRYGDPVKGNMSWGPGRNIVFWANQSEKLTSVLMELLAERKIHLHATSIHTYIIDGLCLNLPIARRPRNGYKKKHWLPIVLRPGAS